MTMTSTDNCASAEKSQGISTEKQKHIAKNITAWFTLGAGLGKLALAKLYAVIPSHMHTSRETPGICPTSHTRSATAIDRQE